MSVVQSDCALDKYFHGGPSRIRLRVGGQYEVDDVNNGVIGYASVSESDNVWVGASAVRPLILLLQLA